MYYKLFNKSLKDGGYTFNLGINKRQTCCPEKLDYMRFEDFEGHGPGPGLSVIGMIKIDKGVEIIEKTSGIDYPKYTSPEINIVEFMDLEDWISSTTKYQDEKERIEDFHMYLRCNPNPSILKQTLAVLHRGDLIKLIKNPSEYIKIIAVQQDSDSIEYIDNPSDDVKLLAERGYNRESPCF